MQEYIQTTPDKLRALCASILEKHGMSPEDALIVADSLVEADMTGVTSHGVTRVKMYCDHIRAGGTNPKGKIRIIRETANSALVDADNSLGIVAAYQAMQIAVAKAKSAGIAIVNVRNSNHCSALSYYAKMAAKEGLLSIICSNSPSTMVPWGSREKYFGTNPFSICVPTGGDPLVLDMATSVVARGKILLADKKGASIPQGWAVDTEGKPTTDAAAALKGSVLPFAGPKGSGIAMMIDIFGGILSGSAFGPEIGNLIINPEKPMNTGHCFIVIDPELFLPGEEFKNQTDLLVKQIKGLQPAAGVEEIYVPGEIEHNNRRQKLKEGINVPASVCNELKAIAQELGITFAL